MLLVHERCLQRGLVGTDRIVPAQVSVHAENLDAPTQRAATWRANHVHARNVTTLSTAEYRIET